MNRADEEVAAVALSRALTLIDQARQGMERHVIAKSRCESDIPARRNEANRLADRLSLARGQHSELARDFAAGAWIGVAENTQCAQANVAEAQRFIEDALKPLPQMSKVIYRLVNCSIRRQRTISMQKPIWQPWASGFTS